jgi:hypothetical protein
MLWAMNLFVMPRFTNSDLISSAFALSINILLADMI